MPPEAAGGAGTAPMSVDADEFARARYGFDLPPAQIAQAPSAQRGGSRLLDLRGEVAVDRQFADLLELLPARSVLVVNDTRVIPARVVAVRPTGGGCELLFVEPEPATAAPPGHVAWTCLARARRPLRTGQELHVGDVVLPIVRGRAEGGDDATVALAVPGDALAFLDTHGLMPLPPYISRERGAAASTDPRRDDDRARYQTVYAATPGAVAAPTAGLHLTAPLLGALAAAGHEVARLTLHVGLGTFSPVRVVDVRAHRMHVERFDLPAATAALVGSGRPVVAVGTTSLRALEAAATGDHQVTPGPGQTDLFVYPGSGHTFRAVDHLITNFHLPESTLLMLVCAFAGMARVMSAYQHAVGAGYRFFSYGDAMLVSRAPAP